MADAEVEVKKGRSISAIWLVPIVALVLGIWMVVHTLQSQGPEIEIVFSSGEGIEADKTKIKYRAVEVGLVESVGLADDLESVVVTARLEKDAASLLREDTQFWVVRPRVGKGGISGLGTILSGGYIQLSPGKGSPGRHDFDGLDEPPLTPVGTPGLHIELVSDRAGSVSVGDPILYKGFRVGGIETSQFDVESQQMRYGGFIREPYDGLVTSSTRFWDASGLHVSAGAEGIEVKTASLETLLFGGVVFGLPEGVRPGRPVAKGARFELYDSLASVNDRPFEQYAEYVVEFTQSVRGLQPGAPVTYRGIQVGHVERIMFEEMAREGLKGTGQPIPVLIRLVPGRMKLPDTPEGKARLVGVVERGVSNGMRATLSTGSLLTGSLYVGFDVYADEAEAQAELGEFAGYPTIPIIESGFEGIQVRVTALLDKLNALPVDQLVRRVDRLIADLDALVANDALQELPASLDATLSELRLALESISTDSAMQERMLRTMTELDRTFRSMRNVMETLEEQPNALIFSHEPGEDPEPPTGSK